MSDPVLRSAPGRRGLIAAVTFVLLVLLVVMLRGFAQLVTDYWWFRSLGLAGVWKKIVLTKILLTLFFFFFFFVLLFLNLAIADRLVPHYRPPGPEDEFLLRYHDLVGHRVQRVRLIAGLLFSLIAASGVASQWDEWTLFRNSGSFRISDPQFGKDVGFYVFRLPFLSFAVTWLFASLVTIAILTVVAHFLNGGIRSVAGFEGRRVTGGALGHVSALLAVIGLVKICDYWLQRYELTTSSRGIVDGAAYTEVKAQLPALYLLMAVGAFSVVLLLVNIKRHRSNVLVVTVALWAFVATLAGVVYPEFVERLRVAPQTSSREQLYIARNIAATREAFGLVPGRDLVERQFDYTATLTAAEVRASSDQLRNVRILDPRVMHQTFQELQGIEQFYTFPGATLDIDQYNVDGAMRQVLIGARVLNPEVLDSFERKHVAITHGLGVAIADASRVNNQGLPEFLVSGVPPDVEPRLGATLTRPQIYFGEGLGGYALVKTARDEVDFTDDTTKVEQTTRYSGGGGVKIGSILRRAMFALRFGQIDPLITNLITDESEVIYVRDVRERVQKAAPFIKWDSDPYPILANGRIYYLLDGFTTSNRFPNAQKAEIADVPDGSGLRADFNYVRNSVKALVDSYDGSVQIHIVDSDDPLIIAYHRAFPTLFTLDPLPREVQPHVRYPLDLLRVQSSMWAKYHVDDPKAFHDKVQWWTVARDAPREIKTADPNDPAGQPAAPVEAVSVPPHYYQVQLPGETELSYVASRTYAPFEESGSAQSVADDPRRQNLTGMIFARNGRIGASPRLVVYELPSANPPGGPAIIGGRAVSAPEISKEISLLNTQGSVVKFGDVLLYPFGKSLLYVLPLYVTGDENAARPTTRVPALSKVIVAYGPKGDQVAIGDSLAQAMSKLFGQSFDDVLGGSPTPVPPPTTGGTTGSTNANPRVQELLRSIQAKYTEADAALRSADLSAYARLQDEIRKMVDELSRVLK